MKKLFTLFAFVMVTMMASAQSEEPLWTAAGTVTPVEDWIADYGMEETDFAFLGAKVKVEGYEDKVVLRSFAGVEGYDLVAYVESYYDEEDDANYWEVTELAQIINGEEQEPVVTEPYTVKGKTYYTQYLYTGDENRVICVTLNADGVTPYYADADDADGYGYFLLSCDVYNYELGDYEDSSYYNCEWAPAEETDELVLWEGEAVADDWKDQPYLFSDAGAELKEAGVEVSDIINFYIEQIGDEGWKLQIFEGHWGGVYGSWCSVGNETEEGVYTEVDLDEVGGKLSLTLTQEMLDAAYEQKWWGGVFVLNGDNVLCTKVTLTKGDATAISAVSAPAQSDAIFNLAGQKVGADYKGIVIKNGRKMIIR